MRYVYKIVGTCDRAVDTALLIFFLLFMLIGGYGVYDSYLVYQNANDTSILKYKPTVILKTCKYVIKRKLIAVVISFSLSEILSAFSYY